MAGAAGRIRLASEGDAPALADIYRPSVEGSAASFELVAPGAEEMAERLRTVLVLAPWLVCEDADEVVGYAYASRHHERAAYQWSVDTSVYVREKVHRRGVARALYETLFAILRLQGFCAAHAGITLPNEASVGLHEALGFRRVGLYERVGWKNGAWHDVGWWQLELRERRGAPPPLLPLVSVQRTPEFEKALLAGVSRLHSRT